MKSSQNGIVMVAFGQLAYLAQAVLALDSVRKNCNFPVTLFTDQPTNPLLTGAGFDCVSELQLEKITGVPHDFALPLLARIKAMRLSPYENTLSLDVDARVRQSQMVKLFDICKKVDIAIAPCLQDTSQERVLYDRPIWNNGVILYKNSAVIENMLEHLETRFREHIELAVSAAAETNCLQHITDAAARKRLLCSDQIALAQLFSPIVNVFELRYAHLAEHWNWRGGNSNRSCAEDVVIDHHPNLRHHSFNQLADSAFNLLSRGIRSKSALYYNCSISALDPTLANLSFTQCMEQLARFEEFQTMLSRLQGAKGNPQSESLLKLALFHRRTLNEPLKANSILNGLVTAIR